jgi:DNA-binding LacI/PurR family transcriptional regulator
MGHTRVAFAHGSDDRFLSFAVDRLEGCRLAHLDRELTWDPALVIDTGDLEGSLNELLRLPVGLRPTAVFGSCDANALAVMDRLKRANVGVPDEISVVGYDDIPSAAKSSPGLSTVRQPLKEMGERCISVLLDLIDGKSNKPQRLFLPAELILRDSVAPPPRARC